MAWYRILYRDVNFTGYDRAEVERLINEGKLTRENKSVSQSVSSLDKEDEDLETIRKVNRFSTSLFVCLPVEIFSHYMLFVSFVLGTRNESRTRRMGERRTRIQRKFGIG